MCDWPRYYITKQLCQLTYISAELVREILIGNEPPGAGSIGIGALQQLSLDR